MYIRLFLGDKHVKHFIRSYLVTSFNNLKYSKLLIIYHANHNRSHSFLGTGSGDESNL